MGFWKTFWVGLLVVLATKVLETYAAALPTWLGDAATWLWEIFMKSSGLPVVLVVFFMLMVLILQYEKSRLQKELRDIQRTAEKNALVLTQPELTILDALTDADPPVDFEDLMGLTKLTRIRLQHAIAQLQDREFLRFRGDGMDSSFELTPKGTAYVVQNDLDKPPF